MTINDFFNMDIEELKSYIENKKRYDKWIETIYDVTYKCVDTAIVKNYENPNVDMAGNRHVNNIAVDIIKDYTRRIKNGEIK